MLPHVLTQFSLPPSNFEEPTPIFSTPMGNPEPKEYIQKKWREKVLGPVSYGFSFCDENLYHLKGGMVISTLERSLNIFGLVWWRSLKWIFSEINFSVISATKVFLFVVWIRIFIKIVSVFSEIENHIE